MMPGGRLRLLKLDGQWYVAGEGYLVMVESYAEGVQLLETLRAEGEQPPMNVET